MCKTKKFLIIIIMLIFCVNSQSVFASDKSDLKIEPFAVEKYTKKVNLSCGRYGYVTATVVISHNLTTQQFRVDKATYTEHFNTGFVGAMTRNFKTNPSVGSIITGKAIKVQINYFVIGVCSETASGYIYL